MAHQYLLRTKLAGEIVTEFLPPVGKDSNRVVIILSGMPGFPGGKLAVAEEFAKKGYWVFIPRYRGTWESGGTFLKYEPTKDVLDVLDALPKGFKDAWSGEKCKVDPKDAVLIGSSFGGPAALLASRDARVKAVIAISSVVDWRKESSVEPLDFMYRFVGEGFGEAYRVSRKDWNKLKNGVFYSPIGQLEHIEREKIFMIHAEDDEVVPILPVKHFAKRARVRLKTYKYGGHFGTKILLKPSIIKQISHFIDKRVGL